eukprot:4294972-Pleurochrysis_carterae.AAC.1
MLARPQRAARAQLCCDDGDYSARHLQYQWCTGRGFDFQTASNFRRFSGEFAPKVVMHSFIKLDGPAHIDIAPDSLPAHCARPLSDGEHGAQGE